MKGLSETEMAIKRACVRSWELEMLIDLICGGTTDPAIVQGYREVSEEIRHG